MTLKKNTLYGDIKNIIEQARGAVVRSVNFTMVMSYWQIGKRIVEEEQGGTKKAGYGDKLIKELSVSLTKEYGNGFSSTNLKYFRQFYLTFPIHHTLRDEFTGRSKSYALRRKSDNTGELSIGHALRGELSWTHYRLLMKVENENARNYYINEAIEQNWSTRTLERQINSLYYERILSSKNKKALKAKANKEAEKNNVLDFVKDPYVLEFLQLKQNKTLYEQSLETELINKLQYFLLELGKGFSFVARQKRVSAENEHFYIDLVFYNYILKCFMLIDLKVGKLTHQDIGQMDFYIRYFEEHERQASDNPTIGLILCTEKNEAIVKYSVLKENKQLFASKYKLYLPTEKELVAELKEELESIRRRKKK